MEFEEKTNVSPSESDVIGGTSQAVAFDREKLESEDEVFSPFAMDCSL